MNRLLFILSLTLLLGNAHNSRAQEISDGLYIGHRGGIIPKYIIMEVDGDSVTFEMFTRWQGSWLPCIGKWSTDYEPQILERVDERTVANENISVHYQNRKNLRLTGTAKQTFVGKVKFNLVKQDQLPERYKKVKSRAMEFTNRERS